MTKDHSSDSVEVTTLISRWKSGDESAASELFERYQQRLFPLVVSKLSERMKRRLDPEDLVMSIMRSVFRMTGDSSMNYSSEGGFWKWFVSVALNKTYNRIDKETAIKRGLDKEVFADSIYDDRIGGDPTADEVVEFTDLLDRVLSKLSDEQKKVLMAKLEGLTQAEIAMQLGVSPKTIQRMGPQLRRITASVLGDDLPEGMLQHAEYTGYWDELLQEKLQSWIADHPAACTFGPMSLGAALHSESTSLEILDAIRSACKLKGKLSRMEEHAVYPAKTLAAAYLLSIAQAKLLHGESISSDSPSQVDERTRSILDESWLDPKSRQIFQQSLN